MEELVQTVERLTANNWDEAAVKIVDIFAKSNIELYVLVGFLGASLTSISARSRLHWTRYAHMESHFDSPILRSAYT